MHFIVSVSKKQENKYLKVVRVVHVFTLDTMAGTYGPILAVDGGTTEVEVEAKILEREKQLEALQKKIEALQKEVERLKKQK